MKTLTTLLSLGSTACTADTAMVAMADTYTQNVDANTDKLIINGIMTIITIVLAIYQKKKGGKNGLSKK